MKFKPGDCVIVDRQDNDDLIAVSNHGEMFHVVKSKEGQMGTIFVTVKDMVGVRLIFREQDLELVQPARA